MNRAAYRASYALGTCSRGDLHAERRSGSCPGRDHGHRPWSCLRHLTTLPEVRQYSGRSTSRGRHWLGRRTPVQVEGNADEPSGDARQRCPEAYFAQYPDGRDRAADPDITHIRIKVDWLRYSDYRARVSSSRKQCWISGSQDRENNGQRLDANVCQRLRLGLRLR